MIETSKQSLEMVRAISQNINDQTFHHHYHILYDIANIYPKDYNLTYLEIGAYAGGSASLMIQRPNTQVISIDLGTPIDPNIALNNVWKHNLHKNSYSYIMGNSTDLNTIDRVKNVKADIIFIDGDHTYTGVIQDFLNYKNLIKENGYIVFDDYNDSTNSPGVKSAVDHIVNYFRDDFEIIGTLKNVHNARGFDEAFTDGNCYIIRKLLPEEKNNIPISVIVSTYRKNNRTINKLEHTLDSVFNQTYKNFKLFLIGDDYTELNELENLIKKYPKNKIYFENLPFSRERKFHTEKLGIWSYGGTNSTNYAIDLSLNSGFNYVCHLDHDDIWVDVHLEEIAKCIEVTGADFICSKAKHLKFFELPITFNDTEKYIKYYPIYNGIVHSSICVNFAKIPIRYRDLWLNYGKIGLPSDGDFYERCRGYLLKNNLRSICVNKVTVLHDTENT